MTDIVASIWLGCLTGVALYAWRRPRDYLTYLAILVGLCVVSFLFMTAWSIANFELTFFGYSLLPD